MVCVEWHKESRQRSSSSRLRCWAWSAMWLPPAQLGPFSLVFSAGGLLGPPGQLKVGPVRQRRRAARRTGAEVKRSGLLGEHLVHAMYIAAPAGGGTCAPSATCAPGGVVAAYWRRRARAQCAGKSIRTLTALLTSPFLSWENFPVALCLLCMYFYVKVTVYYISMYCITCTFFFWGIEGMRVTYVLSN